MSALFEELDYRPTPIGPISLRRRHILSLDEDVFEIILGEEHLMSSLFTASELALGDFGVKALEGSSLDVLVGGLGLGYTAQAVLAHDRVASLTVIDLLEAVIDWHAEGLLPLDPPLSADKRCEIRQGDFFELAASEAGFDPETPGRRYDAVLVDIDHTPDWLLDPRSAGFYSKSGLKRLSAHIRPGGVMGLWSDVPPDNSFTERLASVFVEAWAEEVVSSNPLQDGKPVTQTVYLARTAGP